MNVYQLPIFDDSLADSMKLAAVRRAVEEATRFAEDQLGKLKEPHEFPGRDIATAYAVNCGMLEATVEVLVLYLGQIAGACKHDDYLPFADDLGAA